MAKPGKENPISITDIVPRWTERAENIANEIQGVAEGLEEASPRHLPVVIPLETRVLTELRDKLDALIAEMRAACDEKSGGDNG